MDKSFLDYYQENLEYMRDQGADFAKEFPKIASRLEISENECADPYVERILEGAAFLAAKVERKLDSSMPHMVESVLNNALPFALDLIPSFAIAELKDLDRSNIQAEPMLPANSPFEILLDGIKTPCVFTTMIPISLLPVSLLEARYLTLDLQKYGLSAEAGLYLKFRKTADFQIRKEHDDLLIYLDMPGAIVSRLQQQLQTESCGTYALINGEKHVANEIHFSIPLIDDNGENIKDTEMVGKKIFYQFAIFQPGFHFIRLHGLAPLLETMEAEGTLELIVTFKKRCSEFLLAIENNSLRLNCVPLCNLFRKKSDRMPLEIKTQHHLVADRTDPLSYEISRVLSISLYDNTNRNVLNLTPLYSVDYASNDEDSFNFYSVQRVQRQRGDTEQQRSSYTGQEIFVSFSGEKYQTIQQEAVQFSADMLCTNRDLPLFLRSGAVLKAQGQSAFQSAVLLTSPTAPDVPLLSGSGPEYAEKAACLMVHFVDILWSDGAISKDLMKKMIHAHIPGKQEQLSGLERSIFSLDNSQEMFRYVLHGQVFFESGWKICIVLDELACAGIGYYTFGCVLRELLRYYKPINVPGKIVLETRQQGRISEWMI